MKHPHTIKKALAFLPITILAAGCVGLFRLNAVSTPGHQETAPAEQAVVVTKVPAQPYPVHTDIPATVFWVGEPPAPDNAFITNVEAAWNKDWVAAFGGVDSPEIRNGFWPAGFKPKENPFYFALPFGDYTAQGLKPNVTAVPWYAASPPSGTSILKNRWIAVTMNGKTAYAQWQDVGPFEDDDAAYVFGDAQPKYAKAGLDLSPATADYVGLDGKGIVSWRFVEDAEVPDGPWKDIVTTSAPAW